MNDYAMLGEEVIAPVAALGEYLPNLSPVEGAAIRMQYLTAYGALIAIAHVTKGDFVVITAASSSVGIAAIEIAKAEGAVSIATTRKSNKKAELLSLGANHVIADGGRRHRGERQGDYRRERRARDLRSGWRAICGKAGQGCCCGRDDL
jgi:NADPH:quinone reductase-like Zn-dependent oxidoreductase